MTKLTCIWCNTASLIFKPIPTGSFVEAPDGDLIEDYEEGYVCLTCGEHCNVEEVYFPEDKDD